jgi:bifunctional DNA-binding transcriptional regulator/antitoxin component of YhaV-PrlF toxin-antitoxin module
MTIAEITKATTKGQVTLPKEWRSQFPTNHYFVKSDGGRSITFTAVDMSEIEEDIIFDAERDNNGVGIDPNDIIKLLKKYHG